MKLSLVVGKFSIACSSFTTGFPSLDELRRNGSLLEQYTTYHGEMRTVFGIRPTCSGTGGRISKITFIALPGQGMENTVLLVNDANEVRKVEFVLNDAMQTFGQLGFELNIPSITYAYLNERDTLWIRYPSYEESSLRLLHQVGDVARNVCWLTEPSLENCEPHYDSPLLAIETGIIIYV